MNAILLMPSMRFANWPVIRANLEAVQRREPRVNWSWMPIVYREELARIPAAMRDFLTIWTWPLIIPEEKGVGSIITHKMNAAMWTLEMQNFDGWLYFGADDAVLPEAIGKWLWEAVSPGPIIDGTDQRKPSRIVVFSCKRGQDEAASGYPLWTLEARPENMRVCHVSGEQAVIHASVLRNRRWQHHGCADGILIEQLWKEMPQEFRFVPDKFLAFNALEPGRWDEDKFKEVIEGQD